MRWVGRTARREAQVATLTIRVDDDLRDQITGAAAERGVSISEYIRDAIEVRQSFELVDGLRSSRPVDRAPISLSQFERKVLIMLHRNLLAAHGQLDPGYYDAEDEVRAIKALEGGYAGEYPEEFSETQNAMTVTECELVWDIFDMFRIIQASVRKLGGDGWSEIGVEDAEELGTFQGFDLNDDFEAKLLMYAEYLIENDKWVEQREAFSRENDRGNSHRQMLPTYRAMLTEFKPIWRIAARGVNWYLTRKNIQRVLMAAPGARAAMA